MQDHDYLITPTTPHYSANSSKAATNRPHRPPCHCVTLRHSSPSSPKTLFMASNPAPRMKSAKHGVSPMKNFRSFPSASIHRATCPIALSIATHRSSRAALPTTDSSFTRDSLILLSILAVKYAALSGLRRGGTRGMTRDELAGPTTVRSAICIVSWNATVPSGMTHGVSGYVASRYRAIAAESATVAFVEGS